MENLKSLMDSRTIADIFQTMHQFIHSADAYGNKLKLTFVLMNLIQEESKLLLSVRREEFISEIRSRVNELTEQSDSLGEEYLAQLTQNNEIVEVLSNSSSNRISDLQSQMGSLLSEYDRLIKALVDMRDHLPIEKQLEEEKK